MSKYKDIEELFKIEAVKDEYILTRINKNIERVYLYRIEPVLFLDLSESIQYNFIEVYTQLLRECNFKIQIVISNERLDIDNYIERYYSYKEIIPLDIYIKYIEDIKQKLEIEDVYETKILIVISENSKEKINVDEYDRVVYKLEEIGCKVIRVHGRYEFEKILYKHLNKL